MKFLGIDLGSSSVKGRIFDAASGKSLAVAQYPNEEMEIASPKKGWAEQDPEYWWQCVKEVIAQLHQQVDFRSDLAGIGISYQMHGLVALDRDGQVVRPAIIWCDSRAVEEGEKSCDRLGKSYCDQHLLNSPANFTAAKLKWVKENEPHHYEKIHKICLPGDYLAFRFTGEFSTTASGLSEGIFWDYQEGGISQKLLEDLGLDESLIPALVPTLGTQGQVDSKTASELGLPTGTPISYRAGDQPNNALSLNVLKPGEIAATAGTSGVIYGVVDQPIGDQQSRINTFIHVNNQKDKPRNGLLLCINGTGIMNSWLRRQVGQSKFSYPVMNEIAAEVSPGCDGLFAYPFGNGAERVLGNAYPGAQFSGIDLNRHSTAHLFRAGQEGIVFALNYGFEVLKELGLDAKVIRAGASNMFLSPLFRDVFVNTTGTSLELYDTDGAEGAARGAAIGAGFYRSEAEAFTSLKCDLLLDPDAEKQAIYQDIYKHWKENLTI